MKKFVKVKSNRSGEIAKLNMQLIEDEGHSNPMDLEQLRDRMSDWLDSEYSCYVIEENGRIVTYSLWRDDGEYYYLRHLFTCREHRLKGYAKTLLRQLEVEFYHDKPIRLEVLEGNDESMRFYERLGYYTYACTMQKPVNNE